MYCRLVTLPDRCQASTTSSELKGFHILFGGNQVRPCMGAWEGLDTETCSSEMDTPNSVSGKSHSRCDCRSETSDTAINRFASSFSFSVTGE